MLRSGIIAFLLLLCGQKAVLGQPLDRGAAQRCLNCHGQKHITAISRQERETMVIVPESGMPERKNPAELFVDESLLAQGFHSRVACVECHTGAESLPHPARMAEPHCESCHEKEVEAVSGSRHAKVIRTLDPRPPRCWDCHGGHEIRVWRNVSPLEKVKACASCHQKYSGRMAGLENGGVLVRSYQDSVHGRSKPGSAEVGATCEDCHGNHEILPVKDPRSTVNRLNIPETCGRCHEKIRKEFESTVHAEMARRNDPAVRAALCSDCHTAHSITNIKTPAFMLDIVNECGNCHKDLYRTYRETYHGQVQQLGSMRVAKCSDCHGTHNIRRPTDPQSLLSVSNRAATCSRCHKEIQRLSASARKNFYDYHPHADFRNESRQPGLFWIWRLTLIPGAVLFAIWALHFLVWMRGNLQNKSELSNGRLGRAILRFKALPRRIHLLATACVLGLAFTGLPLKFNRQPWIRSLMGLVGGPDTAVILHRILAILLIGIAIFHGISVWIQRGKQGKPLRTRISNSLLPRLSDLRQFGSMLRWSVGRGSRPALDRWSYREKFDYWALAITVGALACSGFVLWFPTFFARYLSGYWFNVAMVVHSNAGLMAIGFALVIHILNSSLRRVGFPINDVMFTGQLPEEEIQEERSAQYERLAKEGGLDRLRVQPVSDRNRKIAFYGALTSQVLGVGIFILILLAMII